MRENPFSLDFGGTPNLLIPRYMETDKIIKTFSAEKPSSHIFLLMGARGNGKTVLMNSVKEELLKSDKWIHVDLSPESDMMNVFAASLYQKGKKQISKWKVNLDVDLKVAKVGLSSDAEDKYTSVYTDLDQMLEEVKEKGHKVLITVDEIVNSKEAREFTTYFQHCLREGWPVFLLMTGLYKNIRALQNDRSQTFLKRAPKITLGPLNTGRIAQQYREVFSVDEAEASEIAKQTKGYSYAFQILGYLIFESSAQKLTDKILKEYILLLEESSYDKIWEELSPKEKEVAGAAAKAPDNVPVKELREMLKMNSNEFSTYQDTLEKSGVFDEKAGYGMVKFALPYIKEYIQRVSAGE